MRRQEVHEPLVVARRDAEQIEQPAIVAAAHGETAPHHLADVVPGDVAIEEHRMQVLPERVAAFDNRLKELVGELAPPLARRQHRLAGRLQHVRQLADANHRLVAADRADLLHHVLQFAHVAGPAMALEHAPCFVGQGQVLARPAQEIGGQRPDVFAAIAQRRHVQMNDAHPVEQIFTKLPGGDHLRQVAVGGSDDADVHDTA